MEAGLLILACLRYREARHVRYRYSFGAREGQAGGSGRPPSCPIEMAMMNIIGTTPIGTFSLPHPRASMISIMSIISVWWPHGVSMMSMRTSFLLRLLRPPLCPFGKPQGAGTMCIKDFSRRSVPVTLGSPEKPDPPMTGALRAEQRDERSTSSASSVIIAPKPRRLKLYLKPRYVPDNGTPM